MLDRSKSRGSRGMSLALTVLFPGRRQTLPQPAPSKVYDVDRLGETAYRLHIAPEFEARAGRVVSRAHAAPRSIASRTNGLR